jgi:hypothetical protein
MQTADRITLKKGSKDQTDLKEQAKIVPGTTIQGPPLQNSSGWTQSGPVQQYSSGWQQSGPIGQSYATQQGAIM